jgi:hypothetical protein
VLSGHPTFTGYIKLDDTATWMAFVDRLMDHGHDLSGLAPSSYRATLGVNLPSGYPVGAFLPLGVGAQLTGTDVAWLVQPYMATMAGLLALCLAWLTRSIVDSRALRALVAFGAAQSALLFGYALWGGIKEIAVALAIAVLASFAPMAASPDRGWRVTIPTAVALSALLAAVGVGGVVWALPILAPVAIALWRALGARALLSRSAALLCGTLLLFAPAFLAAGTFSPTQGPLTSATELGNLIEPLRLAQYVGIWPSGDFRLDPSQMDVTGFLIALALVAALAGAWFAWRRRAFEPLLYGLGTGVGSLVIFAFSSPWVGAKALASGSPSLLMLALAGAAAFALRVERVLGSIVLVALLGGVLWSSALAYHDVSLAPYAQLHELESIGEEIAGEGPTLMTEYQPYGVRHFLRRGDAEGASELRVRAVPLLRGGEAEKGEWVDTDEISLPALLEYRTLVLRHSPAQSRPPSVYSLLRSGSYYDVWQRPAGEEPVARHLSLGGSLDPAASPTCTEILSFAREAGPDGRLAAVERKPTVVFSLSEASHPESWIPTEAGSPDLIPGGPGVARLAVRVPAAGRYEIYLQGSVRNRLTVSIDGVKVGSAEQQLNPATQFLDFGVAELTAGEHVFTLDYAGQNLGPGSGAPPQPIGPLVLSPLASRDIPVRRLPVAGASSLCGRHLDWVEALP